MTDQYGCSRLTKEDAHEIRQALNLSGTALFPLSGDGGGCLIVLICTQFYKIGVMPFGGNPTGRAYVGVYGRGCNHLSMEAEPIHPGYLIEKLNLHQEEAEWFSQLWAMIWSNEDSP